jgi:hypothetical protein
MAFDGLGMALPWLCHEVSIRQLYPVCGIVFFLKSFYITSASGLYNTVKLFYFIILFCD